MLARLKQYKEYKQSTTSSTKGHIMSNFQVTDKTIKIVVTDVEKAGDKYDVSIENACQAVIAGTYKDSYQNLKAVYVRAYADFTTDVKKQPETSVARKTYQNFDKTVKQLQACFPDRPKKERAKKDKDIEAMLDALFEIAAEQGESEKLLLLIKAKTTSVE